MTGPTLKSTFVSELTKIRSLWSARACLAVTFALIVSISALSGWSVRRAIDNHSPKLLPGFDPANAGFDGITYAQLGLIVFGVLLVTSEYVTGMVRLSLTAVPRRGLLGGAKLAAGAGVAFVVSLLTVVLSYISTQIALGPHSAPFTAPGVPRAMLGGTLYLTLICLISAGIAALLRSQILTLSILLPLLSMGSYLLSKIPATRDLARYLPDLAGQRVMALGTDLPDGLSPWAGLAVMAAWAATILTVAWLTFQHRDA